MNRSQPGMPYSICGFIAILGNIGAVAILWQMPSAYKLSKLNEWVDATRTQSFETVVSSIMFCIGLLALAELSSALGRVANDAKSELGARLLSKTARINAAGTLTPLVFVYHVVDGSGSDAVGQALLGITLSLDALFNLGLAVGLLLFAFSTGLSRPLRYLAGIAGIASLPVSAQAIWGPAAYFLAIAAPFWLGLIAITSGQWWSLSSDEPDSNH